MYIYADRVNADWHLNHNPVCSSTPHLPLFACNSYQACSLFLSKPCERVSISIQKLFLRKIRREVGVGRKKNIEQDLKVAGKYQHTRKYSEFHRSRSYALFTVLFQRLEECLADSRHAGAACEMSSICQFLLWSLLLVLFCFIYHFLDHCKFPIIPASLNIHILGS